MTVNIVGKPYLGFIIHSLTPGAVFTSFNQTTTQVRRISVPLTPSWALACLGNGRFAPFQKRSADAASTTVCMLSVENVSRTAVLRDLFPAPQWLLCDIKEKYALAEPSTVPTGTIGHTGSVVDAAGIAVPVNITVRSRQTDNRSPPSVCSVSTEALFQPPPLSSPPDLCSCA